MSTIISLSSTLWDEAFEALDEATKVNLVGRQLNRSEILQEVINTTEAKKQLCIQKRWKYTNHAGKVIIIRDVLDKLLKSVRLFRDTGDLISQYSPAHALLPWVAIRTLLQVSSCGLCPTRRIDSASRSL